MNKRKILYVVTQSEMGGAQRYVFDLATNLPKDQFDVTVAAGGTGTLFHKLEGSGVKTTPLKHLARPINLLRDTLALFELSQIIKQERPDIVHLNSSKAGVVGSVATQSVSHKSKIIYTAHGWVFNEPLGNFRRMIYRWAERFTAKSKDKIICVSQFDYASALKNNIAAENKMAVVHNGLEFVPKSLLSKDEARGRLNLPTDKTIIGSIGYLYANKGYGFLVEAMKKVDDKVLLAIIGTGEQEKSLNSKMNSLGLKNKVKIVTAEKNPVQCLNAFDIYVCSSVKEGFPYSVLEAMSAGLPIVSTNVGGIPEMLDENSGILVKPKDPSALAAAINNLLKDKQKALALGASAKKRVNQNFTLEKLLLETTRLY